MSRQSFTEVCMTQEINQGQAASAGIFSMQVSQTSIVCFVSPPHTPPLPFPSPLPAPNFLSLPPLSPLPPPFLFPLLTLFSHPLSSSTDCFFQKIHKSGWKQLSRTAQSRQGAISALQNLPPSAKENLCVCVCVYIYAQV